MAYNKTALIGRPIMFLNMALLYWYRLLRILENKLESLPEVAKPFG